MISYENSSCDHSFLVVRCPIIDQSILSARISSLRDGFKAREPAMVRCTPTQRKVHTFENHIVVAAILRGDAGVCCSLTCSESTGGPCFVHQPFQSSALLEACAELLDEIQATHRTSGASQEPYTSMLSRNTFGRNVEFFPAGFVIRACVGGQMRRPPRPLMQDATDPQPQQSPGATVLLHV